jgi:DNA-binding MarR family transcriptional regulator
MADRRPDLELRRLQTQALIDLARVRHASERQVESLLAEAGLTDITPQQANTLMVLFNAREPMTAAALAQQLALSEVTVGRFVRALEESGWVVRQRDPSDSRALLVSPTPRAREALPRYIQVSNALLDRAFAGFDEESCRRFAEALGLIRANLDP